jgi:hypothetical protein
MKRLFAGRRRKTAAVLTSLALIGAGAGIAAWIIQADGDGRAKIGTLAAPVVSAGTASATSQCYPGTSCAASYSIQNPNPVGLIVTAVVNPGSTQVSSNQAACPEAHMTRNDLSGLSIPVPANLTTTVEVPGRYTLSSSAPTGCQGVSITATDRLTFSTP